MRSLSSVALLVVLLSRAAHAAFSVQAGIGFLAITDAAPGADIILADQRGQQLTRGVVDRFGSLIFRELSQGRRYVVSEAAPGGASMTVTVRKFDDHPAPSFYTRQALVEGYNYIEARDGTLLAAMVRAPLGKTLAEGPFPTVVEYSGYDPANPENPEPVSLIASALGYATVGVNMRGSGCSGGVIDLFDLPTTADGYDIIETVAVQPWVQSNKVGMVGISFSGISQTFVGGAQPPHLAAVAPLSVIADIYQSPGFPGGIFNNGFAKSWLQERKDNAEPAPEGGQGWARKRVNDGDETCRANQRLRLQTQDPIQVVQDQPFYDPATMFNRSPINWVGETKVPMFLSCAWQDEQTGGGFAQMLSRMPRRPDVKMTLVNGVHTSSLDPAVLFNWLAFLDLYVAHRVPSMTFLSTIAPIIYGQILEAGAPTPPLPEDRFTGITDYDQALQLFEHDPSVRVLMENGAGSATPGLPAPTFELGYAKWPPPEAKSTSFYLGPNGSLAAARPRGGDEGSDSYHPDPSVRPRQTLPNGHDWDTLPPYDWQPLVDGTALAYATPALTSDLTIVGPSSVDLWLRSSAEDTDVQVTLTEIRPDGLETLVQSGWLRASHRKLAKKLSSALDPRPTHLEDDARFMPAGKFVKVRVGLFSVAHVFRKGSRLRLAVSAPGGDRPIWTFETFDTGGAVVNEIARTTKQASRLVLPVVAGVQAPPALPPCPGLRAQPCRTYVPLANGG